MLVQTRANCRATRGNSGDVYPATLCSAHPLCPENEIRDSYRDRRHVGRSGRTFLTLAVYFAYWESVRLWVFSALRFSTKESDEITRFMVEDYYADCGNFWWTNWSTPKGFNILESLARGYVVNMDILLTSGSRQHKVIQIKLANWVRNRDCFLQSSFSDREHGGAMNDASRCSGWFSDHSSLRSSYIDHHILFLFFVR